MLNRIINLIKQDFDKHCDLHDDCNDCPYSSDYDAPCHRKDIKEFDWNNYLLKKVSVTNNWISVNDRLPKESCECLVATNIGGIFMVEYSHKYKAFNAIDDGMYGDKYAMHTVTHWQPLPEPPKGE